AGRLGALHGRPEDRVGLPLDLDAGALKRLACPSPVLDADVDDPASLEADAEQALDVDPGLAERLADAGEASRTILDADGEIGRHAVSFPKGVRNGIRPFGRLGQVGTKGYRSTARSLLEATHASDQHRPSLR